MSEGLDLMCTLVRIKNMGTEELHTFLREMLESAKEDGRKEERAKHNN